MLQKKVSVLYDGGFISSTMEETLSNLSNNDLWFSRIKVSFLSQKQQFLTLLGVEADGVLQGVLTGVLLGVLTGNLGPPVVDSKESDLEGPKSVSGNRDILELDLLFNPTNFTYH